MLLTVGSNGRGEFFPIGVESGPTLNRGASVNGSCKLEPVGVCQFQKARPTWPGCIREGWCPLALLFKIPFCQCTAVPYMGSPICGCQAHYYLTTQLSDITRLLLLRQIPSKPGGELAHWKVQVSISSATRTWTAWRRAGLGQRSTSQTPLRHQTDHWM